MSNCIPPPSANTSMKIEIFIIKEESGLDKVIQALIACNSLYGLGALAITCFTVVVLLIILKPIVLKMLDKYDYLHAKFSGTSVQSEIDLQGKAA